MSTKNTGDFGENLVAEYLTKRKYRILERKYRCFAGEIDLIAEKKGIISFIEVKTRTTELFGRAAESVTFRKQKKIIACAHYYISQNNCDGKSFLFDVAEVYVCPEKTRINYIGNAFQAHQ